MRYDLSDVEWQLISPILPHKSRGVRRVDDSVSSLTVRDRTVREETLGRDPEKLQPFKIEFRKNTIGEKERDWFNRKRSHSEDRCLGVSSK